MTDPDHGLRVSAARALRLGGGLIWVAAAIHFVALLPLVIGLVMGVDYFGARPFLAAALIILAAGIVILVPLVRLARRAG